MQKAGFLKLGLIYVNQTEKVYALLKGSNDIDIGDIDYVDDEMKIFCIIIHYCTDDETFV